MSRKTVRGGNAQSKPRRAFMKKSLTTLAALAFVGAMTTAAFAGPVTRFDYGYLDEHPDVAHQLGANPSLADNPQFLATHPGLDSYLSQHPEVRQDLQQHPYRFMTDEWRLNHGGSFYPGAPMQGPGPVARFDKGYLDDHPEVAEQLGHDPRLADNPQFLATHPGLDDYLRDHPEVRDDLLNHPDRFMARERYYENHGGLGSTPHPLASTDRYMDSHPEVAQQLEKDPALVDNHQYVDSHPGLHDYLQTHPVARADWKSHPYRYMASERHFQKNH
jgi:hypothetical protein